MKTNTKIIIGLLLFFVSVTAFAQDVSTKKKKINFRKQMDSITKSQIKLLKEGALLIRLKSRNNTIIGLRKIGKVKLAEKIKRKQADYNLKVITAFKTNFDFCPTYFFISNYSINIKDEQFDKVVFLNDSMIEDMTIKLNTKKFLTAEFGIIEQDTAKYFSHKTYEPDEHWSLTRFENYYGGANMGFGALVIKSDKFIQLRRPFPYYVRTFDSLPFERSTNKIVRKMNKKLHKFYNGKIK